MNKMHTLLSRQIKRNFGDETSVPKEWQQFISNVNDAYCEFDADRSMLERSMDLSSKELIEKTENLKRKEEMLILERDRAQMFLDIAGVIIVAIDVQGCVTLVNRKGCEILGYNQNEILGKNWFDLFLPERIRNEAKEISRQLFKGETEGIEYHENPVLTQDGGEKLIAWHNVILKDTEGEIIGHMSSGEDITDSRIAQDELRTKMQEIEKLNKFMIGREMRIIEMKKEVNDLLKQNGQPPRYKV